MPSVSICIPAYREPEFLARAVESVLSQDFHDFEIVVTDDSPGREVMDVVSGLKDARIRYYKNPQRLGSPANWIAAVAQSQAPLIKFMHHDDRFAREDSLGRFVAMLDDRRVDFAFSASQVVDLEQSPLWIHRPAEQIEEMRYDPCILLFGNWIGAPSATIYRRSARARIDVRLRWVVDIDLYLSVLKRNRRFAYDEHPLVATTTGAPHQVTTDVQSDRKVALAEWFILAAKWAPLFRWRGDLLEYLRGLQLEYGASEWRDFQALGLRGRAAVLFALTDIAERLSRDDEDNGR